MHIVFNMSRVGLGNNGGSRTVVKCAENLSSIGVDVTILGPNKYTWHKPRGINFKTGACPKCDVVIATGYRSVPSTVAAPARRKFYYIRGFEVWLAKPAQLVKSYKSLSCIVNSEWLHRWLRKRNIKSHIVYPGLDVDIFNNKGLNRDGIGALFSKKHVTKRHCDAIKLGSMIGCAPKLLNKHIKSPSAAELNSWYNKLKVWFAPTELEGLHNPPMESSLAGCALVCTDHKMSGMSDYAIDGETAILYPARNLELASKAVRLLLSDGVMRQKLNSAMVTLLINKIGTRRDNMHKLLSIVR